MDNLDIISNLRMSFEVNVIIFYIRLKCGYDYDQMGFFYQINVMLSKGTKKTNLFIITNIYISTSIS